MRSASRSACAAEAGELIAAYERDLVAEADVAEIGEIATGAAQGRADAAEITVFKSVGAALEDLAAERVDPQQGAPEEQEQLALVRQG